MTSLAHLDSFSLQGIIIEKKRNLEKKGWKLNKSRSRNVSQRYDEAKMSLNRFYAADGNALMSVKAFFVVVAVDISAFF